MSAMRERQPIEVLIVDDHPLIRRGLAALIDSDPALRVVAQASNGAEAVELFKRHRPAVVVTDQRMPQMDGAAAIAAIRQEAPAARIVVVSPFSGDAEIDRAFRAGAAGYVLKDAPGEEILRAIHAVHAGRRYVPSDVASRLADAQVAPDLSVREVEVLHGMARGLNNRTIGAELGIEEATVKGHVRNILGKLGVAQRTEAVVVAAQRGVIKLDG